MAEAGEAAEGEPKKLKEDPWAYLGEAPIAFRETSDCILRLDSGERLPVHKSAPDNKSFLSLIACRA